MNEIINSILKAETKAVEIVANANEQAKKMIIDGEEIAEKIKSAAISNFKNERNIAVLDAENKATEVYNSEINNGTNKANALKNACEDKIDIVADEVIRRLFS